MQCQCGCNVDVAIECCHTEAHCIVSKHASHTLPSAALFNMFLAGMHHSMPGLL